MFHKWREHNMNLEDFNATYARCVLKVKHPTLANPEEIMYIDNARRIENSEGNRQDSVEGSLLSLTDPKSRTPDWIPIRLTLRELEFNYEWPQLGLINAKGGCIYLTRQPSQGVYRRGFFTQLVGIEDINEEEKLLVDVPKEKKKRRFGPPTPMGDENINLMRPYFTDQIFNRRYYSPTSAIRLVQRGSRIAAAVSNHLCVTTKWWARGLVLVYKTVPVAEFKETANGNQVAVLFSENEHLIQQVQQHFNVEVSK